MSDINELVELFEDAVFERPSERDSVCAVTTAIGYSCLEHFLDDNSGACEKILEFITDHSKLYVELNADEPAFKEFVGDDEEIY
tara:strand:- start:1235 stop:1486 length:252 start_codon:yes stop_codon:yes gene_type:complete